ncbi:coiled-coil domain-containing protein 57 [Xenopus laevis]|uniref:Coiled-coil domain-containing protein 57 n=2 Tax=Xenopus laevis TaxID=8355 RepID=A0A974BXR8_XENLA|nr:coiled-coil domain-containing protein 57 [Xenopus laevis]OCT62676.1 hypothetical protein XELAEV_18043763mg [Xenopus laevis]
MLPKEEEFSVLLAKKEQEWRDLQQLQVQFLEKSLEDTKKELQEQKEKFSSLKKDFTYNLKVLGERDRELEQFEVMLSQLKVIESGKQTKISDLSVQIEKLQQQIQKEKKKVEDLQSHYQRKLKENQLHLERVRSSKNHDIDHCREEYEKVKRQLERKIEDVQSDLSLQKQELMLEFDTEMKKQEHEFRLQLDEMSTVVLSHELKVKLLTKELSILREKELQMLESLQQVEIASQKLQEALKQKEWEIENLSTVKDARIRELEDKLKALQLQQKKEEDTFQRKHEQLDRFAREKESALTSIKEAHLEQVQNFEKQIKELHMCTETLQMENRRAQSTQQELLVEKEAMIEKLKQEVDTLKNGWDSYISQISKESVNKDLQIQALKEDEEKLKAQITRCQKDIEKYQQQLARSVEIEHKLEEARIQAELDWQKRCELVEKTQYQHSEELIESLIKAKDKVAAELKEKDRKLNELELLVSTLSWERDKAVDFLKKHGAKKLDMGEKMYVVEAVQEFQKQFPSDEIRKLQEQNAELRNVIGQMRKEMESASEQIIPPAHDTAEASANDKQDPVFTPDYVQSLEDEIRTLKQKISIIEERIQEESGPKKNLPVPAPAVLPENAESQSYKTTGPLGADKGPSVETTKRLDAGAAHLDSMVSQLTQKSVTIDQLRKEIQTLQHRLTGCKVPKDVCPETHVYMLSNKLREAATKISQLSLEKQQLIDMGNRLRAELASIEIHQSVPPASDIQENGVQNRLSALENLQYNLTSQELQFAQYQKTSNFPLKEHSTIRAKKHKDNDNTPEIFTEQPYHTVKQSGSKENKYLLEHQVNIAPSPVPSSSLAEADSSLQDVWKLLDIGSSLSLISSQEDNKQVTSARNRLEQRHRSKDGSSTDQTLLKRQKERTSKSAAVKHSKPRVSQNTTKIRNYSVKD